MAHFAHPPKLVEVVENALWQQEPDTGEVIKAARGLEGRTLAGLPLDLGLFDLLRERGQAG